MPLSPPIPLSALAPELILLIGGCAVLLFGQAGESGRRALPWAALLTLVTALLFTLVGGRTTETWPAGNGLVYGPLAHFVRLAGLELGILLVLVNWSQAQEKERGEFLSMLLFSLAGLLLVGPADNLIILFLAIELVSIPNYIMVALSRANVRALEAGTKYFYLGALSAAVLAYGLALLYGVSGTMSLAGTIDAVAGALSQPATLGGGLATAGVVLALGGLLFKIAAVPLHFYVADVYQGAAASVAGVLGFVPKLGGFVAIMKIVLLTGHWQAPQPAVFWLLWWVAALSMTVGNVLALRQTSIKRLLAYSGVAHSGYMLVGVLAGPLAGEDAFGSFGDGASGVLFYVVIYGIANLGAFAVLGLLRVRGRPAETLRDVAGLLRRQPGLALLLVLAMFTLMSLPPTPGFWGKLGLFGSALAAAQLGPAEVRGWMIGLVVLGVLNSALAAAYYLRVIAAVLLYESDQPASAATREAPHMGALLCGFLTLIFMFYPGALLAQGRAATAELAAAHPRVAAVAPAPATP